MRETGNGGIGVIARDSHGRVVGGVHCAEQSTSAVALEAKAVLLGVKLAIENNWDSIVLESDAEVVLNHVLGIAHFWEIETTIRNSLYLARSILNMSWVWIPRVANQSADWLAKRALEGMCHSDWVSQPHSLSLIFCGVTIFVIWG